MTQDTPRPCSRKPQDKPGQASCPAASLAVLPPRVAQRDGFVFHSGQNKSHSRNGGLSLGTASGGDRCAPRRACVRASLGGGVQSP